MINPQHRPVPGGVKGPPSNIGNTRMRARTKHPHRRGIYINPPPHRPRRNAMEIPAKLTMPMTDPTHHWDIFIYVTPDPMREDRPRQKRQKRRRRTRRNRADHPKYKDLIAIILEEYTTEITPACFRPGILPVRILRMAPMS